ncbi:MAG TPA: hypothetical protein VFX43_02675 [Chitinophagaceae bacterium]|nr:hypothetical protein [Chitinophagaceae bacterium]
MAKAIGITCLFMMFSLTIFSQQRNNKQGKGLASTNGYRMYSKHTTGQETFFPLMAWDYVDDISTLKAMKDCGVNIIGFVAPKMLNACVRYGMKAIVFDTSVAGDDWTRPFDADRACRNLPGLIKKVNKNPAVYGYHLKDEPAPGQIAGLARAVAMIKKLAPGKFPYVNLLPGAGKDYLAYLEQFVNVCKPTVISYDRYSLGEDGKFSTSFWENIAVIRNVALQHNIPFWNTILTSAHWQYREVTAADLRLEMFGSLVYGAKGIAFYKFFSRALPILKAPDLGNFRMGPLDQFGEKTITWYWLRNINHQISNLGAVLLNLHSDDVYHIGNVPKGNHGPNDTTLVKSISGGGEFVVGDFTHEDGTRYVMIVNKSLTHSYQCNPQFKVKPKSIQYVSPWTGKLETFTAPWYYLAPGQGVLIHLL